MRAARFADAMGTLDRLANEIDAGGTRFHEPELARVRGEILLAQSDNNVNEAEAAFRQALAVAARQSCRALELRAAVSLARLLGEAGRGTEARNLLAPIYSGFTEGFDKADLVAAKVLLAELN